MTNRDLEERIAAVLNTRQSVVPSKEGSKKAKKTGGLLQRVPRRLILQVVRVALASKQEEAYVCGKRIGGNGRRWT